MTTASWDAVDSEDSGGRESKKRKRKKKKKKKRKRARSLPLVLFLILIFPFSSSSSSGSDSESGTYSDAGPPRKKARFLWDRASLQAPDAYKRWTRILYTDYRVFFTIFIM